MMFTHKSLMTVCCAAVLAFGLAACGSSSDDDKVPVTMIDDKVSAPENGGEEAPAGPTPEQKKAAAATKATAIAAVVTEDGLGGTDVAPTTDEQNAGEYNLAIKHGETSITVEGATPDEDVKFTQARDFGDGRTMHVLAMEADSNGNVEEEVVIVSTDIEAPKATAFAMVHDLNANPETAGDDDYQSVLVGPVNLAMIATDGITAPGSGLITVFSAEEATPTEPAVAAFETAATFDGAPGKLKCAGADDCTVTLDADGEITAFSDGWEFTPADDATIDEPDIDYLHYGFWLMKTTDADDAITYDEVQTFAGSSIDPSVGLQLDTVQGTASYEGGAVGVYVRNVFDSEGEIDTATSGHFNADASLMAYFSGGDVPGNKQNSVTGTIDNFVLQHEEENAWSVALEGARAVGANTFSGTANGGGAVGMFSGTYHGLTPQIDEEVENERVAPGSVVGEFHANFSNGSVAGGFGARKQ